MLCLVLPSVSMGGLVPGVVEVRLQVSGLAVWVEVDLVVAVMVMGRRLQRRASQRSRARAVVVAGGRETAGVVRVATG